MMHAVDIRRFPLETDRVRRLLGAMSARRPSPMPKPWLVLWGPGDPERQRLMRECVAKGGHAIALDLAYWNRDSYFRVSIDAPHPQAWVMRRDWPAWRLERTKPPIADYWDPRGPVIVAGIGAKAHVQYKDHSVLAWEQEQAARITDGRRVYYRRKHPSGPYVDGMHPAPQGHIDTVLRGASLVITWHSNVAVDALRLGIPAVCRDGAAAAVCPSEVLPGQAPLGDALRMRFLQNLAWFQWGPHETNEMFIWAGKMLRGADDD